jgi:hypothetical protein
MLTRGKKALLALVAVAMLAAMGFIAYTSKQAAEATENPNTHAGRINRAIEQAQRAMDR